MYGIPTARREQTSDKNVVKTVEVSNRDVGGESTSVLITLNVGGQIFQTTAETLRKTGVGKLAEIVYNDNETAEKSYFFDRDPDFFAEVMKFYRTGEMHFSESFCARTFSTEMEFWEIPDSMIGQCCWRTYCKKKEELSENQRLVKQFATMSPTPHGPRQHDHKTAIWNFLEYPTSSGWAKVWSAASVTLLLVSVICYSLTTLPSAKRYYQNWNTSSPAEKEFSESWQFLFHVILIDVACLTVFTVELLLRIYSSPSKVKLCKSLLFLCDVLFLIPGWIIDGFILTRSNLVIAGNEHLTIVILQLVTITRVLRIVRLAWYFKGVRILLYVLRSSVREIGLLCVFILIGMMFFGFLIYSAEVSTNENFDSAFRGFWWAIVTMSTVGYGDFYPITVPGYIIAACCAVSGIVLIGMPIPIIAGNFYLYYGFRERPHNDQPAEYEKSERPNTNNNETCSKEIFKRTDSF